eukprot:3673858-Rhodomonas_salina.1
MRENADTQACGPLSAHVRRTNCAVLTRCVAVQSGAATRGGWEGKAYTVLPPALPAYSPATGCPVLRSYTLYRPTLLLRDDQAYCPTLALGNVRTYRRRYACDVWY